MDERFIYLGRHNAVRVCNIISVAVDREWKLRVFTTDNTDNGYVIDECSFNEIFGTNYSPGHIKDHFIELFINELGEGVVNRPKYNAVNPVLVRKTDNSIVKECPVCGRAVSNRDYSGGIHACGQCGVMLDYDK